MSAETKDRIRDDPGPRLPPDETGDRPTKGSVLIDGTSPRAQVPARPGLSAAQGSDMQTLRRLLLGKDYETLIAMREDIKRVLALEEGLRYPDGQTDLVAGVLSEAILLREGRDQGISRALGPAVSDAIKVAVRKDPEPVVEAVCPVIGPAFAVP